MFKCCSVTDRVLEVFTEIVEILWYSVFKKANMLCWPIKAQKRFFSHSIMTKDHSAFNISLALPCKYKLLSMNKYMP